MTTDPKILRNTLSWAVSRPFKIMNGINLKLGDELKMFMNFQNGQQKFKSDLHRLPISEKQNKKYKGRFRRGRIRGEGVYSFPDRRLFKGQFSSRNIGRGTMQFPNGETCTGSFKTLKSVKDSKKC